MKKILACYDLSVPSQKALQAAIQICHERQANLVVVHALTPRDEAFGKDPHQTSENLIQRIREEITDQARRLFPASWKPAAHSLEIIVTQGNPAVQLLRTIEAEKPDLVVQSTHGRTGLFKILLGSVAEKIIRHSTSPVLTVRNEEVVWPPQKLLLPLDFSKSDEEALLFAGQIVPRGVELFHVVNFTDLLMTGPNGEVLSAPLDENLLRKQAAEKLEAARSRHSSLPIISQRISLGPPGEEICAEAGNSKVDLILMPTQGRTGLARFFLGSVAAYVIREAPCNVLTFCPTAGLALRRNLLPHLEEKS